MAGDPTEAMVRREVEAARRILREDRILAKLSKAFPDEPETPEGQPPVPPKKDPADAPAPKAGLWWGTSANA